MNLAFNLIGFSGLTGTGSGSGTSTIGRSTRGSSKTDFASLLQTKMGSGTAKSDGAKTTNATSAATSRSAVKAADQGAPTNVEDKQSGDPGAMSQTAPEITDAAAKEGTGQMSVETQGENEAVPKDDTLSGTKTDSDLASLLDSNPSLKELMVLLAKLISLVENQAGLDGGDGDEAAASVEGAGPAGDGKLLQMLMAKLMPEGAGDADGAMPTAPVESSAVKDFANQLMTILSAIGSDNGDAAKTIQTESVQTAIPESLASQPDVTVKNQIKTTKSVVSLIEQLEEALRRLEGQSQEDGTQTVSKATVRDQAKTVKNLVRSCLQMIKAAEVVYKTGTTDKAAQQETTEVIKTDTAAGSNPLPVVLGNEPKGSGQDTAKQPSSGQNGSLEKDTTAGTGSTELFDEDQGLATVQKAAGKEQSEQKPTALEQKPTAVLVNQTGGVLEQQVSVTPTAVKKLVETEPQQVLKPIIEGMRLVQRESVTEMNIQLKPESLGKLNLRVSVENGLVTAKLVAESQSVGRLIESSLGQLKQSLQEQGLRFDRIEVSVGDSSAQPDLGQQFNRQYQNQSNGNQTVQVNYGGGDDYDWSYYPTESSNPIRSYGSDSQYDFLA